MPTINETFINALLADASYVSGLSPSSDLSKALSDRMTPTLAAYIGKNFSVVTQIESPVSSFDATLWRANNADGTPNPNGKIYVSMRGTQQLTDFLVDVDLALTGNARAQVTDMVNWWLRISTPAGQQAKQVQALGSIYVAAPTVPGEGIVSASDLAAGIEVNGHSLGGYLATAFTRLFGAQAHVQHTSTFNSAGFAPGSEGVFKMLDGLIGPSYGIGRFPSQSEQTNYFAKNGLNVTTNSLWFSQQGQRVELFNELSTDALTVPNHFMYKLTDSLALGNALSKLDTTFTTDKLNVLLSAGSNQAKASIEGVFDGLRHLLQGTGIAPTQVADVANSDSPRPQYHASLADLQNSAVFQSLQGKVSVNLAINSDLAVKARSDFGTAAGLIALSPITLSANNADGKAALDSLWQSSAWNSQYQDWLADYAARQNGGLATHYTDAWLYDRQALVQFQIAANLRKVQPNPTGYLGIDGANATPNNLLYFDMASGTKVEAYTSRPSPTTAPNQYVIFGGSGNDTIYAGGGSNIISGGGGQDYITINGAGGNVINANGGRDIIYGGNGANRIYADKETDVASALGQLQQATASGTRGNFITVGAGNNTLVGGDNTSINRVIVVTGDILGMNDSIWKMAA